MQKQEIYNIVTRCPLLHNVDAGGCRDFVDNGRPQFVAQSSYFFHQGEPANQLYILLSGQARLTQVNISGNQVILYHFGPGDGLGIIVALSSMKYPASAEAIGNCQALSWDTETIQHLMLQYPQIAFNGMKIIANRFSWLQDRYQEMATQRVEQRIAQTLLRLSWQFGKRIEESTIIDMTLSRQDLAEMTGTNIYNVSRIFKQMGTKRFHSFPKQTYHHSPSA
ncbi:MAG: Crp/Fnr family transcriptional regulator [Chloroflexi bacterium]|nr:Crp/Fnr family transcriptional regulator [Chloroflexota bacterium]